MASDIFTQIGSDIYGAARTSKGWSTSLSANGSVVAIGSPFDGGNGNVSIYKKENNNWIQVGSHIDGEGGYDRSGYSVSLSDDGSLSQLELQIMSLQLAQIVLTNTSIKM